MRQPPASDRAGEEGYALVAAVASIAVFAAMALTMLSATRSVASDASAEQAQLQADAAVDAGFAMAMSKLLGRSLVGGWSIDGTPHRLSYNGATLMVRIDDERGKVSLNGLDEKLATRLLQQAGLTDDRLLVARDSLLDWEDNDQEPRPFGAEASFYASRGIAPRDGDLASVDELRLVRGFDARTIARLRPMVTTYAGRAAFDPHFAGHDAMTVMQDGGEVDATQEIDRARERAGQRTAIAFTETTDLLNRPLTITVEASLPDGARATRRSVVQITGASDPPYVVMASD